MPPSKQIRGNIRKNIKMKKPVDELINQPMFLHENKEDYIIGIEPVRNLLGNTNLGTVKTDAVHATRKMIEDILFDTVYKIDMLAKSPKQVTGVHVVYTCNPYVIGYPHVIGPYEDIVKRYHSCVRYYHSSEDVIDFFSDTSIRKIIYKSKTKNFNRTATETVNRFVSQCLLAYMSNLGYVLGITKRAVISYRVAVGTRILSNFPDDTALKLIKPKPCPHLIKRPDVNNEIRKRKIESMKKTRMRLNELARRR